MEPYGCNHTLCFMEHTLFCTRYGFRRVQSSSGVLLVKASERRQHAGARPRPPVQPACCRAKPSWRRARSRARRAPTRAR
eukprot:scaffold74517_cov27-Phaeocystis_antarctica.AAC.1